MTASGRVRKREAQAKKRADFKDWKVTVRISDEAHTDGDCVRIHVRSLDKEGEQ